MDNEKNRRSFPYAHRILFAMVLLMILLCFVTHRGWKPRYVKPPLVGESPINLECKLVQILNFGEPPRVCSFVIGEVVLAHVRDELWVNGDIDSRKLKAIGRLEPTLYCRTTDLFELPTIHERAS